MNDPDEIFRTEDPSILPDLLDLLFYDTSHFYDVDEVEKIMIALNSRSDCETKNIQDSLEVCREYILSLA